MALGAPGVSGDTEGLYAHVDVHFQYSKMTASMYNTDLKQKEQGPLFHSPEEQN